MFRSSISAAAVAAVAVIGTAAGAQMIDRGYGAYSGTLSDDVMSNAIRAENIIGADIYTMNMEYDENLWGETTYYDEIDTDWEDIGEIEDIIISRDGQIMGLVAEVGGWLGIGDENVVISMDDVRVAGRGVGNYAFVTRLSEERMEAMPSVDEGWTW